MLPARWVAWGLSVCAVALAIAEFAVSHGNNTLSGQGRDAPSLLIAVGVSLPPFTFTVVGAFIVTRRPGNRIGWIMIAVGLGFALAVFASDYPGVRVHGRLHSRPLAGPVAWMSNWVTSFYLSSLLLLLLLFPTGRLAGRRWRAVLWVGLIAWLGQGVFGAVQRGPMDNNLATNPLGIVSLPDWVAAATGFLGLIAMVGAILSLLLRFRTARGEVREQLKWFTYGASLAIVCLVAGFVTDWSSPPVALFSILTIAVMPVFMGIAILRYRLYDIDVLINRTMVYGTMTALLALLYVGDVILLQTVFRSVTGTSSELTVALTTLGIAALFQPLRVRVQRLIDRRFYRRKYDAARTLAAFGSRVRDEVDLELLSRDLVGVAQETMQTMHISLWLRQDERRA